MIRIGDQVAIIKPVGPCRAQAYYPPSVFNLRMKNYEGRVGTVKEICPSGRGPNIYIHIQRYGIVHLYEDELVVTIPATPVPESKYKLCSIIGCNSVTSSVSKFSCGHEYILCCDCKKTKSLTCHECLPFRPMYTLGWSVSRGINGRIIGIYNR